MDGRSPGVFQRGELCCHCLLVESRDGLVLVDTGYGLRDIADPRSRLSAFFLAMLSPDFREEMTAVRQIGALGFSTRDVRHIVLTHLDFDHAGGLDDFPQAKIHLMARERDSALSRTTWLDRQRYRPQQWSSQSRWVSHGLGGGETWNGFQGACSGEGLPEGIAMVPLHGHTFGHAGVAIQTDAGWLLQAGDAYFHHGEMSADPWCPPGLRFYQTLMEKQRAVRLENQRRLRQLGASNSSIRICCSHDTVEFEHFSKRADNEPAAQRL